jgi:Heavy-metal resistance
MTLNSSDVKTSRRPWLPQLRSRWWTLLLGLSLMVNLLIFGLIAGQGFDRGPVGRIMGASYVQLIPRRFLSDLPHERRKELMAIVKKRGQELRGLRQNSFEAPLKLAEVLEKDNATAEEVKAAIDVFTVGSGSLAASGGAVVNEIVSQLTVAEKKSLAAAIRERATNRNKSRH